MQTNTTTKIDESNPHYYTDTKHELRDIQREFVKDDAFVGYCVCNMLKYLKRLGKKSLAIETQISDLKKIQNYAQFAIEVMEEYEV